MAIGDAQRLKGSALIQDILAGQRDIDTKIDSSSTVDFLLRRNEKPAPLNRLAQGIQHREDVEQLETIKINNRQSQINEFISEAPELESEIRKLDEQGSKMREIDNMIREKQQQQIEPETKTAQQITRAPVGFALEALGRGVVNTGRFFSSNLVRGIGSLVMNSIINNPTSVQSAEERQVSAENLSEVFFNAADAIDSKLDDLESLIGKKPEDMNIDELSDIVDPKKIVSLVLESAPTTAALAATTIASGGLTTLPIIFTSVTGSEAKELLEREDLSLPQKLSTATSIAAVEGVLETVGLGSITKPAKQGLIRNVTRIARGEGGTEAAQEAQAILQKEGVEPFKAEQTWAQVAAAGVVGAISGVTVGTAIEAAQQGRPTEEGEPSPVQEVETDPEIVSGVQDIVEQGAQIQRERNPDQFIRGDRFQPVTVSPPQVELAQPTVEDVQVQVKDAPKDPKTTKIPTEDTPELYEEARRVGKQKSIKRMFKTNLSTNDNLSVLDKTISSVASNLGQINPVYKTQIRNMDFRQKDIKARWGEQASEFVQLLSTIKKKLGTNERFAFDMALSNGNRQEVVNILSKLDTKTRQDKDPVQIYDELQELLVGAREMALEHGIEIGNVENFFPRVVSNLGALTKKIRGTEFRGVYDEALRKAERDKGRELTREEQLEIIDRTIGYKSQSSLSTSNIKERRINTLNADLFEEYFSAEKALDIYFQRLSSAIAQQEFFRDLGIEPETKNLSAETIDADPENVASGLLTDGLEQNIGKLILKDIESGRLKPEDQNKLDYLLTARFNIKPLMPALRIGKTLSTGLLLGRGFSSPLKQLADISASMYDSGVYSTGKSLVRAAAGRPKLTLEDINIEDVSAAMIDISRSGKVVDRILKTNLFRTTDKVMKETVVNSKIDQLSRQARKGKFTERNKKLVDEIFDATPEIKAQLLEDLKAGNITQDVKLLAFHSLARIQPTSLSELPPAYFTSGNGRVFFTLKTFQAKRLDFIREEALRDMFGEGRTKKERAAALTRLTVLMSTLSLLGELPTDELIRWARGQKSAQDFPDKMLESYLKTVGVNKFQVDKVGRQGLFKTLTETFLSLPVSVVDEFLSDFKPLFTDAEFSVEGAKSMRNVPLVGEGLYFWLGAGEIKNIKNYVRSVREELKERRLTQEERFAIRSTLYRYTINNPETLSAKSASRLYKELAKNATNFNLPESTTQKFWEQFKNEIKEITALPETIMK